VTATLLDAAQIAFLESRRWAALATGRRDGSPQLSHVGYVWDGEHILVSVKSYTAKVFGRLTRNLGVAVDENFVRMLDAQQRTVLRITPTKATMQD
jgi:hypothetical protein